MGLADDFHLQGNTFLYWDELGWQNIEGEGSRHHLSSGDYTYYWQRMWTVHHVLYAALFLPKPRAKL